MHPTPQSEASLDLVRVTTAARLLGVSRQRVHVLIAHRRLRTQLIDRALFVVRADVEQLRDEREARARQTA